VTAAQIAKVREASDLVAIAAEYTKLTKRGKEWWCRCLFHSEKSGSLHFHPEMQVYKCFGCSASGDVFAFVMAMESIPFPQAVKVLADRAGIDLDREERLTMDQKVEIARRRQQAEIEAEDCAALLREFRHSLLTRASEIREMVRSFDAWASEQWCRTGDIPGRGWEWLSILIPIEAYADRLVEQSHHLQDADPAALMIAYREFRARYPLTAAVVRRRIEDKEHALAIANALVDVLARSQECAA